MRESISYVDRSYDFSKETGNPDGVGGRENILIFKYWHLMLQISNSVEFNETLLPATNL